MNEDKPRELSENERTLLVDEYADMIQERRNALQYGFGS